MKRQERGGMNEHASIMSDVLTQLVESASLCKLIKSPWTQPYLIIDSTYSNPWREQHSSQFTAL